MLYASNEGRGPKELDMRIIEPAHKDIMQYLDCCYFGKYHKGQCECHSRNQFKSCYENAKKRLTRYIYTDEEIQQSIDKNAKAMADIEKALSEFFD